MLNWVKKLVIHFEFNIGFLKDNHGVFDLFDCNAFQDKSLSDVVSHFLFLVECFSGVENDCSNSFIQGYVSAVFEYLIDEIERNGDICHVDQ